MTGTGDVGLESQLASVAQELGVVGAQLSIAVDGAVTDLVYGEAHLPAGTPMRPATLVQIGSVTKLHTALTAMTLVERGCLDLDAPVVDVLPEFATPAPHVTEQITLRHLLSMSGGLDNGPYVDLGDDSDASQRYVQLLRDIPSILPPGTGFGYSNMSTIVAGRMIETSTGWTWDAAVRRLLLEPAGLQEHASRPEEQVYHPLSLGYEHRIVGVVPVRPWTHARTHSPSGSTMMASAGDLVRLAQVFLGGGVGVNGARLLSAGSIEAMHAPQVQVSGRAFATAWGLGPAIYDWDDGVRVFGHPGGTPAAESRLVWNLRTRSALAMTCNTPDASAGLVERVFLPAAARLFGARLPEEPATREITDPRRFTGRFERYHQSFRVWADGDRLFVRRTPQRVGNIDLGGTRTSELKQVDEARFIAVDPSYLGRGADVAFVTDASGSIVAMQEGAFTARRVGETVDH